eukprot:TRINITY_DN4126_c0_g1_i1.p1 TRINITY_DN4126_c0_g1~~TRINITY_DN4126_c0_g1_i1.p1  ORF type:complete len:358 (+),score=70.97 TRINITY_DN4126_c0_g1_i1:138-1211(+)
MGKKGKKGKKKEEKTREIYLLEECVTIQESLPFVAVDKLDELAYKKVARFLNMVGLLAEFLQIQSNKDYRFNYHHKYLAPTPQFFPFGFDVNVIRQAIEVQEKPTLTYNGVSHSYSEEIKLAAESFLKEVDSTMTKIASEIEPRLKDNFSTGFKRFKCELKEDIEIFDQMWMGFESKFVMARHAILSKVFEDVERLITLEALLTQAEERLDIETKQRLENDFVCCVQEFTHLMFPETKTETFPSDVIPLAEACIFYESKCTDEWLHLAKYLIKDYLELRIYIMKIPEERLQPKLKENAQLMRLLKNFYSSVLAAKEALEFVSRLPKLIHAKTSDWMTKRLLEPDLRYIQKTAHLAIS